MRDHPADELDRAGQIGRDHPLDLIVIEVLGGTEDAGPGIRENHVDAIEGGEGLAHHGI